MPKTLKDTRIRDMSVPEKPNFIHSPNRRIGFSSTAITGEHMCGHKSMFIKGFLQPVDMPTTVIMRNSNNQGIAMKGDVLLCKWRDFSLTLKNVLLVPGVKGLAMSHYLLMNGR